MKLDSLFLTTLVVLAGCNANVKVDPEGYQCDPGNACPTGFACREGLCRRANVVDTSCDGVTCTTPPAPSCLADNVTLRTFAGRCVAGQCQYDPIDMTCPAGCAGGACVDPCASVSCLSPPPTACADANTLRTFAQTGTCANGSCSYQPTDTTCANGCENARCKGVDLCASMGVICNMPPAAVCAGATRTSFTSPGTCDPGTGTCTYAPSETMCPNGCALGQCLTPSLTFAQTGPRIRFAINALDVAPGSSGNSALAVGDRGKLARWDGSGWMELTTPSSTTSLNAVAFVTGTVAYAVGENRTAWKLQPGASLVSPVALSGSGGANLVAVSGRAENELLIASDQGEWWRLSNGMGGANITNGQISSTTPWTVTGAYLDEAMRERIVGSCGSTPQRCVATRGAGNAFTVNTQTGSTGLSAVGGAFDVPTTLANDALVGRSSTSGLSLATHNAGLGSITALSTPTLSGGSIVGITAQAVALNRDVFVLTSSAGSNLGHLYRLVRGIGITANDALQTYYGEEHLSPNDANGVLVAEVRRTRNVNNVFRRGVLTNEALDVGEDFIGASVTDDGTLVLAGAYGDFVTRAPMSNTFDFRRPPTDEWTIKGVEARRGTGTILVGANATTGDGLVVRVTPMAFTTVTTQANTTFHAACRVSDSEGWVVGSGGAIWSLTSTGASAVTSPTTRDLLSVDCAAGVAIACGADGTVLRFANGQWSVVPGSPLAGRAVKVCRLFAQGAFVGGDGFFHSLTTSGWTTLAAKTGLTSLVVRGPQEVYGAFVNGDTSELQRFDGVAWSPTILTVSGALGGGVQAGPRVVWGGTLGAIVESR